MSHHKAEENKDTEGHIAGKPRTIAGKPRTIAGKPRTIAGKPRT